LSSEIDQTTCRNGSLLALLARRSITCHASSQRSPNQKRANRRKPDYRGWNLRDASQVGFEIPVEMVPGLSIGTELLIIPSLRYSRTRNSHATRASQFICLKLDSFASLRTVVAAGECRGSVLTTCASAVFEEGRILVAEDSSLTDGSSTSSAPSLRQNLSVSSDSMRLHCGQRFIIVAQGALHRFVNVRDVRVIERAAAAVASCAKRRIRSRCEARSAGSTFNATLRSSRVSSARYNSPIPPSPIFERIS
jgi:hypothetical protein